MFVNSLHILGHRASIPRASRTTLQTIYQIQNITLQRIQFILMESTYNIGFNLIDQI